MSYDDFWAKIWLTSHFYAIFRFNTSKRFSVMRSKQHLNIFLSCRIQKSLGCICTVSRPIKCQDITQKIVWVTCIHLTSSWNYRRKHFFIFFTTWREHEHSIWRRWHSKNNRGGFIPNIWCGFSAMKSQKRLMKNSNRYFYLCRICSFWMHVGITGGCILAYDLFQLFHPIISLVEIQGGLSHITYMI